MSKGHKNRKRKANRRISTCEASNDAEKKTRNDEKPIEGAEHNDIGIDYIPIRWAIRRTNGDWNAS